MPFGELWSMRIDVPYSFLVIDGENAWSCGQLALDPAGAEIYLRPASDYVELGQSVDVHTLVEAGVVEPHAAVDERLGKDFHYTLVDSLPS